jgi:anthranilate synthase component 1
MLFPSFDEYVVLSKAYDIVPVYQEVLVDMETPISIYKKLGHHQHSNQSQNSQSESNLLNNWQDSHPRDTNSQDSTPQESYLLESVEGGEHLARYSFIGLEPFLSFRFKDGAGVINREGREEKVTGKPLAILEQLMSGYKAPLLENLPRFYGGAVGYFGYDLTRTWEELPSCANDDLGLPDCHFVLTNLVLIFDHVQHKLKIVYNSRVGQDAELSYHQAQEHINRILVLLARPNSGNNYLVTTPGAASITSNLTKEQFMAMVEQAKDYIRAGDIFQVVLSQRFQAPLAADPFDIYRSLRRINPAPYLYYLDLGDTQLIGSSPEMLVRVEDGRVETRPLAGTRPRGNNTREDQQLAAELLADEKEKAEHVMLVDLGRNDLGRVCNYSSVEVTEFMQVERYSHVMHMVTQVEGQLGAGHSQYDALEACFPAGTVSGAPKIRAMEIIAELEPNNRGAYAGAIGYLSFTGNMDTCITIRTIVVSNGQLYVQAGAGIVADSVPELEYQETVNKAMALLKTLQMQQENKALA